MGVYWAAIKLSDNSTPSPYKQPNPEGCNCWNLGSLHSPLLVPADWTVGFNLVTNSIPALQSRQPSTVWLLLYYLLTVCLQQLCRGPKDSVSDVPGCPMSPGQVLGSPLRQLSSCPVATLRGAHPDRGFSDSAQLLCSCLWVPQVGRVQASGLEAGPVPALSNCPPTLSAKSSGAFPVLLLPHSPQHNPTCGGRTAHTTWQRGTFPSVRWLVAGRRWRSAWGGTFAAAAPHFSPDCSAVGFPASQRPFWVSSQSLPREVLPCPAGLQPLCYQKPTDDFRCIWHASSGSTVSCLSRKSQKRICFVSIFTLKSDTIYS